MRTLLKIPNRFDILSKPWTKAQCQLLGKLPDEDIAMIELLYNGQRTKDDGQD